MPHPRPEPEPEQVVEPFRDAKWSLVILVALLAVATALRSVPFPNTVDFEALQTQPLDPRTQKPLDPRT